MKKYVNGQYIELTEEEVQAWEEAQREVEEADSERGGGKFTQP